MSPTSMSSSSSSYSSSSSTTVLTSTTNTSPTGTSSSPDLVTEVIVGGLIAGIFVALILAGIGYFLCERKKRRGSNKDSEPSSRRNTRGRSIEGSDPLLYPTISQLGQGEFNPYADTVSLPVRPAPPEISLDYSEIDILEPLPSSSSMMQRTPMPLSPARPSLPPLDIPRLTVASPATNIARHPTTAPAIASASVSTVHDNNTNNYAFSAVSVVDDDATSESSMSAYSQASASTRIYRAWEDDTQFPPIPEIPSGHYNNHVSTTAELTDENTSLARGNTAKVATLLKSRARRAQRGKSVSRSSTKGSRIERNDSLLIRSPAPSESVSLTIRNPFEDASSSSRSTSVTTSIANHTAHAVEPPSYAHRLSIIDNEEAETESVYADEISTLPNIPDTAPLRITKNQILPAHSEHS
ncbi:hypothetical protein J3R30DRAFT_1086924 [Lentinula aciculospora]|uniref:Uncharacterized protein n=1 Tax=Lentinula aciculospora TaxID=153920 RepID=A0A9W9A0C8_9AGAR|nr:hypothetical protein J3R30DRAFT_1086924 [Lentinula aciculospora]